EELGGYPEAFRDSWVYKDLYRVRNARPALAKFGAVLGSLYSGLDMWLHNIGLGVLVPWTFKNHADHTATKKAKDVKPIAYPKPDGKLTFDRLSSVFLSNTNHEEDQPVHLTLKDPAVPIRINLPEYAAPEQYYCPAAVYEIVEEPAGPRLQI